MDRYILSEMLQPLLAGVLMFLVMLIGNTLYNYIEQILKSGIPLKIVLRLIVYNVPILIPLVLPAATALASAWSINRLARDFEVTPIRMAGVPLRRLFLPVFAMGALASLISFEIGDRVAPWAQREFTASQSQIGVYALLAAPAIAENQVFRFQDYTFHIREIRKDPAKNSARIDLEGVTIFRNSSSGGFPTLITAQSAEYDRYVWTLHDAVWHTLGADGFTQFELKSKLIKLPLYVPLSSLAQSAFSSPDQLSMEQLGQEMKALSTTQQDYASVAYNYYAKVAIPFMCFAFALCAPPLTMRFAKTGAYSGIFISLLMVWVAWNTLLLMRYMGDAGTLNPAVAAWTPDVLFSVVGLFTLARIE